MNPRAFMLLDRLEKLMCAPQPQHPLAPFLGPVASMSRGWKGTLLKFGGEEGEGRVHLEDTFSVPLGSFQSGWPTSPTLWPGSRILCTCNFCVRALLPLGFEFFFLFVPAQRPAVGHQGMVSMFELIRVTRTLTNLLTYAGFRTSVFYVTWRQTGSTPK